MEDLLTSAQHSDRGFTLASSATNAGTDDRKPPQVPTPSGSIGTPSDCNTTLLVDIMFPSVIDMSMAPERESAEIFLSEEEGQFLEWVRNDLAELSEPVRSSPGAELCRRFAEGVGMALAFVPRARCAVFGDEEDGVELVAHSRASMRQVSFEFRPEDNSVKIVSIDEKMRRSERKCRIDHARTLAEAIAWLNPH